LGHVCSYKREIEGFLGDGTLLGIEATCVIKLGRTTHTHTHTHTHEKYLWGNLLRLVDWVDVNIRVVRLS
jgi:hypothetical protein